MEQIPMEYRLLGRTGVKVSSICLGTITYHHKTPLDEACRMIDRSIDMGINFIDTANIYSRGGSEQFVGKALKRNGKRDRMVLATKVHGTMDDDDPNMAGNTRRHIIEQCEASLDRLGTDRIDLYQIHRPSSDVPIDEALRALDDLIRAGKVRYIGTSTYAAWQITEALWCSQHLGLNRMVCEQPPYNLLDRRIERELVPMAQTFGIALIPWSPIGGGLLTGKYRRDKMPVEGRWIDQPIPGDQHINDLMHDMIDAVCSRADEKGCTPSQLALAWCMQQPGITSAIIGPRTYEQLEDNLGALDVTVTDDDLVFFDAATPPGQVCYGKPWFGEDFGPHQYRW